MVFLTVHYLVSTSFQSWRIRALHQKIARILDSKNTVVFLKQSDGSKQGIATALATSDICVNSAEASVQECIWSNELAQGISITPKQIVYVNPFITFPPPPSLIPFPFGESHVPESNNRKDVIHALIEVELNPEENPQLQPFEIEQLAHLIAWKIDTKLSILIKTDVKRFSQLIFATFVQNHYVINDRLTLSRIETVEVDGHPQEFSEILSHSKKDAMHRTRPELNIDEWKKNLEAIKNLGVLANQASEFELKKNLTEGKTGIVQGIVQPDLIASRHIEDAVSRKVTSPDTPKKTLLSLEKTEVKMQALRNKSFTNLAELNAAVEEEEAPKSPLASPKFPIAPRSPSKSPSLSIKSKASIDSFSQKFPVSSSPAKNSFFSNEAIRNEEHIAENIVAAKHAEEEIESKKVKLENATEAFINNEKEVAALASEEIVKSQEIIAEENPVEIIQVKEEIQEQPKEEIPSIEITSETLSPEGKKPLLSAPEAPKTPNAIRYKPPKLPDSKPPNVLVYSDSTTTRENVIKTLSCILSKNMYSIYPLTIQQIESKIWVDNTSLLVVCGTVNGSGISDIFLEYFLKGGKILCLCSDLLRQVLPTYHTAEVREHELVQFSYGKWKNIKMMHHIFCYQPSPVRKHFSQESDEPPKDKSPNSNPLIVLPRSVELRDEFGLVHNVNVQILGTEDTWKTPSLLMVYNERGGKMIFSQIHLEMDPSFYESDDQKYQILMKNDSLRHEIFGDVLSVHLGLETDVDLKGDDIKYTKGFFLGRHEMKFEVLDQLKLGTDNILKIDALSIQFCGKNQQSGDANENSLPIMIHTCPDDFSTVEYFDTLNTENVGRLLLYSHIMTSTMDVVKVKYRHGLAAVSRLLTKGKGRSGNKWISPPGCLMFTLQLHVPLDSALGRQIGLIQHLMAAAVVSGLRSIPGYKDLPINIKWPNDIYANGDTKIGGLIVTSSLEGDMVICNIGVGVNLSNSAPTTCINNIIVEHNKKHSRNLQPLTYEKTLAIIFNETESIFNRIQLDDVEHLYNLYYSYWLHTDTTVTVISPNGKEEGAKILGIDDCGYLKIQFNNGKVGSVTPDNNSFDLLRGLIVPKYQA